MEAWGHLPQLITPILPRSHSPLSHSPTPSIPSDLKPQDETFPTELGPFLVVDRDALPRPFSPLALVNYSESP